MLCIAEVEVDEVCEGVCAAAWLVVVLELVLVPAEVLVQEVVLALEVDLVQEVALAQAVGLVEVAEVWVVEAVGLEQGLGGRALVVGMRVDLVAGLVKMT